MRFVRSVRRRFLIVLPVLFILVAVRSEWFEVIAEEWHSWEVSNAIVEQEKLQADQYAKEMQETWNRITYRWEIVDQVARGEITPDQAVDQFMLINQSSEEIARRIQFDFPADSLRASTRLQVAAYLRCLQNAHPNQASNPALTLE